MVCGEAPRPKHRSENGYYIQHRSRPVTTCWSLPRLLAHLDDDAAHVVATLGAYVVGWGRAAALRADLNLTRLLLVVRSSLTGSRVRMSSLWYCHVKNSKNQQKRGASKKFWERKGYLLAIRLSSRNETANANSRRLPLTGIRKACKPITRLAPCRRRPDRTIRVDILRINKTEELAMLHR